MAAALCTVCNQLPAIYTCPRCATRTCSLPCSTAHKARAACSGERDRAAYVPMNRYTWGTMMDDYVYLEDVGRRVGEWGSEIVRGKFHAGAGVGRGRGRGRARGRGRGGSAPGGAVRTKRDVLRMHLEERDIEMEILPAGMERHQINQSTWDSRNQTAVLTIELIFHPPPNPLASQPPDPPYTLLTHRNKLQTPLLELLQRHIADKKERACPAWVRTLVCPEPDAPDAFVPPHCVMLAPPNPLTAAPSGSRTRPKRAYYRFDPAETLATLLCHTRFFEFPTIEVWEEFPGTVVDKEGAVTQTAQDDERALKRRRIDRKAGGKAIAGLLDGYGSSSEDASEEKQTPQDTLEMLGGYLESDDDADDAALQDEDEEVQLDPAALLELMRQARGDEKWTPDMGDGELVDWGESDEDAEA